MSKQSSRGTRWDNLRNQCLTRDQHTCTYCGNEATTADHITPKNHGGTDDLNNLVAACLTCNGRKQDKLHVRQNWTNTTWLTRT